MKTAEAIQYFGTAAALAKAIKIKPPSVSEWGDYPPITRQYQIQVITNGELKAETNESTSAA